MNSATTSLDLNKKVKIGLAIAVVLGVLDIISLAMPAPEDDAAGPPIGVLVFTTIMGLLTIVFAFLAWKRHSRNAIRGVVVTRFLSALSAVPAFFVSDVPGPVVVLVAVFVVVTVVTIALVMSKPFTVQRTDAGSSAAAASRT